MDWRDRTGVTALALSTADPVQAPRCRWSLSTVWPQTPGGGWELLGVFLGAWWPCESDGELSRRGLAASALLPLELGSPSRLFLICRKLPRGSSACEWKGAPAVADPMWV